MKLITALGIGLTSCLLMSSYAMAASNVFGGSVCHAYDGADTQDIIYYSHGIVNAGTSHTVSVICPIAKRTNDYNGITARINIDSNGANTVSCTLYSRGANGGALGSKSVRNNDSGKETLTLRVPTSTPTSYFAAVCKLPANEVAEIYSLEVLN